MDGYQNHLTKVKMTERNSTKHKNYYMYILEPADLVTFSEDL